ncbi:hypothetical protein [Kitasatospora albolonga]|uniref:hypothetical protein n=1 Tax=Kitasatospora albolonga TaxID=68173 RepID=UPI0031E9E4A7
MSARIRRRAAVSLVCALTTGTTLLLTACDPATGRSAAPAASSAPSRPSTDAPASPTAAPSATATPSASATPTTPAVPTTPAAPRTTAPGVVPAALLNRTAHTGLTISNGTNLVVMDGTTVDFHTAVRDLSWSPDGSRAAFVDGNGDLVTSRPDGTGRSLVAKNPGGQSWSHPTWQVSVGYQGGSPKKNLFFTITRDGTTRLATVPVDGAAHAPAALPLGNYSDENAVALPTTGNTWINGSDRLGTTVYANTTDGDVYIRDDYLRQQGGVVTKGSQPAISADGDSLVFVRPVGGHNHVFRQSLRTEDRTAKDLTPYAGEDFTEPAWSRDGKTVAVRTPAGIAVLPADGSAAPELVSSVRGLPAYRG